MRIYFVGTTVQREDGGPVGVIRDLSGPPNWTADVAWFHLNGDETWETVEIQELVPVETLGASSS